jgi:hypothetical protein
MIVLVVCSVVSGERQKAVVYNFEYDSVCSDSLVMTIANIAPVILQ